MTKSVTLQWYMEKIPGGFKVSNIRFNVKYKLYSVVIIFDLKFKSKCGGWPYYSGWIQTLLLNCQLLYRDYSLQSTKYIFDVIPWLLCSNRYILY